MIRALIAGALIAGVAIHFGVDSDVAIAYTLIIGGPLWLLWPLLRRAAPRRRRPPRPHPIPRPAPPGPHLTQINHHHYYGPYSPPRAAPPPADQAYRAPYLELPQHRSGQQAHDAIYNNVIDTDR